MWSIEHRCIQQQSELCFCSWQQLYWWKHLIIDASLLVPTELKCPVPEIENGYVTEVAREYKENDILHFRCNTKFKQREERPSKCSRVGLRAEWSPMPECERKYESNVHRRVKSLTERGKRRNLDSPASFPNTAATKCTLQLPPLEGTTYLPSFKTVFVPGETLSVTCGEKFWISSAQDTFAETTCNDEGQWTISPVCKGTESQHWDCCVVFMVPEPVMADLNSKLKSLLFQRLCAEINASLMSEDGTCGGASASKWEIL